MEWLSIIHYLSIYSGDSPAAFDKRTIQTEVFHGMSSINVIINLTAVCHVAQENGAFARNMSILTGTTKT